MYGIIIDKIDSDTFEVEFTRFYNPSVESSFTQIISIDTRIPPYVHEKTVGDRVLKYDVYSTLSEEIPEIRIPNRMNVTREEIDHIYDDKDNFAARQILISRIVPSLAQKINEVSLKYKSPKKILKEFRSLAITVEQLREQSKSYPKPSIAFNNALKEGIYYYALIDFINVTYAIILGHSKKMGEINEIVKNMPPSKHKVKLQEAITLSLEVESDS